jgi:uncharacterized protein (DUF2336 family)
VNRSVPALDLPADEARRVRQGADAHAEPEVLQALAADRSATVRAALALNPMSPPAVDRMLAKDPDERVRILLARRLAGLVPALPDHEQTRLHREAYDTLTALASDAAVRVRAAVADVLKDMPRAPRELILQLAQDHEIMVSAPVILFSPRLATDDLVELIAGAPASTNTTIAAGRAGIDGRVSDAVAATANDAAIHALLANPTAQIREATLDALILRAVDHLDWHEPLVRRPALPPRAARALAGIVATHLIEVLSQRNDLPQDLTEELRARLTARLEQQKSAPARDQTMADAMAAAQAMARDGALKEETVLAAARNGDTQSAAALLAVASGTPISVVLRAASLRSAKGLVSLTWRAGFGMRTATALQMLLGRLGPDAILAAAPGDAFPLAIEEMRWQLDFLGAMRSHGAQA